MSMGWRSISSGSVAVLMLLSASCWGSLLGFEGDGDPARGISARVVAMGGASLALSSAELATFANPAQAVFTQGPAIWGSFGRLMTSEEFVTPVDGTDEFDFRSSDQEYYHPLSMGIQWSPARQVGIAVATLPCYDYRYEHELVLRDPVHPARSIGIERVEGRGDLRQYAIAVGAIPAPWLALGGEVGIVRGRRESEITTYYTDGDSLGEPFSASDELDGEVYAVGVQIRPSQSLTLAAVYRPRLDVGSLSYPASVGFGAAYGRRWGRGALFAADVVYRDQDGPVRIDELPERVEVLVGSEIRLRDDAVLRYGIAVVPWYRDETIESAVISAGIGRKILGFWIDVAASVGTRNYVGPAPHLSDDSRINESSANLVVTVAYGR